ncbi:hypothetical protein D9758_009528 [Tetrapyrgos nigripes]|uniref:Uncharacterized protein n=1 Tax=Tetrapyrgos nigripes TaxID=182062 RepID=A0A8H5G143_9AGAR|nr:hypothetical protein D9758_009528 [Tetrapyrgos nigripes]
MVLPSSPVHTTKDGALGEAHPEGFNVRASLQFYWRETAWKVLGLVAALFLGEKLYGRGVPLRHIKDFVVTLSATVTESLRSVQALNDHAAMALLYVNRALPDRLIKVFPHLHLHGHPEVELGKLSQVQLGVLMARVYNMCLRMVLDLYEEEDRDPEQWQQILCMSESLLNKSDRQLVLLFNCNRVRIRTNDWLVWLNHLRSTLSYPFQFYFPKCYPSFEVIFMKLLRGASKSASGSRPGSLVACIDMVPSPLRYKQQERLLLFLSCGLLDSDVPRLWLDQELRYNAKVVVKEDDESAETEWDEDEDENEMSESGEELQRHSELRPEEDVGSENQWQWVGYEDATAPISSLARGSSTFQTHLPVEEADEADYEDEADEDDVDAGVVVKQEYEDEADEAQDEGASDVDTDEVYDDEDDEDDDAGHAHFLGPQSAVHYGGHMPAVLAAGYWA